MSEDGTKLKITENKFSMGQVAQMIGVHRTTILRSLAERSAAVEAVPLARSAEMPWLHDFQTDGEETFTLCPKKIPPNDRTVPGLLI